MNGLGFVGSVLGDGQSIGNGATRVCSRYSGMKMVLGDASKDERGRASRVTNGNMGRRDAMWTMIRALPMWAGLVSASATMEMTALKEKGWWWAQAVPSEADDYNAMLDAREALSRMEGLLESGRWDVMRSALRIPPLNKIRASGTRLYMSDPVDSEVSTRAYRGMITAIEKLDTIALQAERGSESARGEMKGLLGGALEAMDKFIDAVEKVEGVTSSS
uniref:Uncharacterized protein n=1 Tax=Compsopogon caeruleus TaxID=31354 RepID=A0A7S1TFT6_9RHOD